MKRLCEKNVLFCIKESIISVLFICISGKMPLDWELIVLQSR